MKNECRGDFKFRWSSRGGVTMLDLQDRTLSEAMEIAAYMGYKPRTWYRPSTWGNHYTRWAKDTNRQ
jgi:hypothetical protein